MAAVASTVAIFALVPVVQKSNYGPTALADKVIVKY
ncbi:hypothetical protein QBD00_002096 [Ochrobactrum sp. AN78]|jgi:hypothetical protein|nr:hypothetical protein [Ochrobactrum sp. AN78]